MRIAIILGVIGGAALLLWKHVLTPPPDVIHIAGEGGVVDFEVPLSAQTYADRDLPLFGTPEQAAATADAYDSFDRGIKELYATGMFS